MVNTHYSKSAKTQAGIGEDEVSTLEDRAKEKLLKVFQKSQMSNQRNMIGCSVLKKVD